MRITHYTWIRRSSGKVFFYKVFYDKIAKFIPYIWYEMWEAMVYSRLPGIIERINITTSCFFGTGSAAGIIPCFHGDSNHFITFMVQHKCSNGTINTSEIGR